MTAAVKQAQDERAERTKVTADMVVEEFAKHAFGTMQDFFDPDDGHLLDVHEMSLAAKSRLAALDVGVGALIQRGGRAVAGMLTIATAGGS